MASWSRASRSRREQAASRDSAWCSATRPAATPSAGMHRWSRRGRCRTGPTAECVHVRAGRRPNRRRSMVVNSSALALTDRPALSVSVAISGWKVHRFDRFRVGRHGRCCRGASTSGVDRAAPAESLPHPPAERYASRGLTVAKCPKCNARPPLGGRDVSAFPGMYLPVRVKTPRPHARVHQRGGAQVMGNQILPEQKRRPISATISIVLAVLTLSYRLPWMVAAMRGKSTTTSRSTSCSAGRSSGGSSPSRSARRAPDGRANQSHGRIRWLAAARLRGAGDVPGAARACGELFEFAKS